ncbi:hypothetical protein D3C75_814410 [compost metagenome]
MIAGQVLVADVEGVAATLGRQHAVEGLVVDGAGQLVAVLAGVEVAEVGAQGPGAERLAVLEAEEALLVDVLQLRVPGADAGAVGVEGVVGAGIVEAVAAHRQYRATADPR